jgi:hypothetical protein
MVLIATSGGNNLVKSRRGERSAALHKGQWHLYDFTGRCNPG